MIFLKGDAVGEWKVGVAGANGVAGGE